MAGIVGVLVGYGAVLSSHLALFGLTGRLWAATTQSITLVVALASLVLAYRGRVRPAALLVLATVWVELHSDLPLVGIEPTAAVPLPALISAAGMLLGGRAAFGLAALTSATVAAGAALSGWTGGPGFGSQDSLYLWIVLAASMFASAFLIRFGLEALGGVIAAAEASEQRLTGLIENAPDGIVSVDQEGRIVSVNPAAQALLGVARPGLQGRPILEVLETACADEVEHGKVAQLFTGGDGGETSVAFRGDASQDVMVDVVVGALPGVHGPGGLQVTLRDISAQRRSWETERLLRAQLEHAQRLEAVGRLAGGVAHEFNNLLTVVGGSAELLLMDSRGGEAELAREIIDAKTRGAQLTRQLLAFARKEIVQPARLEPAAVVREIEPLLRRFVTERHSFSLALDEGLPGIVADRAQVEQVLVNLVVNAKDAMPGPGRLVVGMAGPGSVLRWSGVPPWEVPDGFVEFWVEDTGTGMDPDTAARAFEPFFTTKARGEGTGLGLATVHGIVSQNGGTLSILSRPEAGTRVCVRWPVAAD
jgi:PAS domain S-box-containing protein